MRLPARRSSLALLAAALVVVGCSSEQEARWEPSESANPSDVLDQARFDRVAGRYEAALEKHVWFHENALKHRPSLFGVRLSFALAYWRELADQYPPALEKMKQIRDEAEGRVRADEPIREWFIEFESLNRYLDADDRTVALFAWLDAEKPAFARRVYSVALDSLVAEKEFDLCSKYIDATDYYGRLVESFRYSQEFARQNADPGEEIEHDARIFTYKTAQLVAILVNAGRSDEAEEIADQALQEWPSELIADHLHEAKEGVVPARIY